jgi:hypothetical protein
MGGFEQIDVTSAAFARRFAALLYSHRTRTRQYLWRLSRHSDGQFSVEDLQEFESGHRRLDEPTVEALLDLYGAVVDELIPRRVPLEIFPTGILVANGVEVEFDPMDPMALLESYLQLVRQLRDQLDRKVIEVRREDVEILGDHLDTAGSWVVTQLAQLMGANERERRAMAAMFIAGASVISVSTPPKRTPTPVTNLADVAREEPHEHPSRYHVVIPDRGDEPGTVTVLADWQRDSRGDGSQRR